MQGWIRASAILARVVVAGVFASGVGAARAAEPSGAPQIAAQATAAGKLLVAGFSGARPGDAGVRAIGRDIAAGRVGGVALFRANIANPERLRRLIAWLRAQAPAGDLVIMVDQEGGRVARLTRRNGWRNWPSAARAAALGLEAAGARFDDMARALAAADVDVNLAPVVDVAINPRNPVIVRQNRSFGAEPERVAAFAERFIAAHAAAGVRTCLKHFPGHGASRADTHDEVVSLAGLWRPELELAPYIALINRPRSPVGCVMTSHLFVPELAGAEGAIVTFSAAAVRALREAIGFRGVVLTDDLAMEGAKARARFPENAVRALIAGHDMVLIGASEAEGRRVGPAFRAAVAAALQAGRLDAARLEESLARRAAWAAAVGRP